MRDELTDLARELVAIDSVNPGLVPGGAGEEEISRFVAAWLERRGLEVYRDEIAPGRWNVSAFAHGSGGGRSLLLNAPPGHRRIRRDGSRARAARSRATGCTGAAPTT